MKLFSIILIAFMSIMGFSQETKPIETPIPIDKSEINLGFNHLAPSKAAFYSAVVPGLGQIYNKSYWKLPIAYSGLGISSYLYFQNQKEYNRWRNEYKKRLQGIHDTSDAYFGRLDNDRLIRGQRIFERNRDLALVVTIGIYALNILDANIDAHLKQFDISEDLSLYPAMEYNHLNDTYQFGIVLNFKF